MTKSSDAWLTRTARKLARQGVSYARPNIPSKSLRAAIQAVVEANPGEATVFIPHYWAVFVNDGRKAISMPPGAFLVWFRDPTNDPRRPGGHTPERAADFRRLTPAEFKYWMAQNRLADQIGSPRPMIVTKAVSAVRPAGFFDNDKGMALFVRQAHRILREDFDKFVRQELGRLPKSRTVVIGI